jgi:hypothetical protein
MINENTRKNNIFKRPTVMRDDLKAVHRSLRNRVLIVVGGILFTLGTAVHVVLWCM